MNVFLYSPEPAIPARQPLLRLRHPIKSMGMTGLPPASSSGLAFKFCGATALFLLTNSYYCVTIVDYMPRG